MDRVKIEDYKIIKSNYFRYLELIIHKEVEIEDNIVHKIKVGWMKGINATKILCNHRIFVKWKEKFYKTVIRPAMLYSMEYWTVRKLYVYKINVAEMRILKCLCRIRNKSYL